MNKQLIPIFPTPLYVNDVPLDIIEPYKNNLNQEEIKHNEEAGPHFGLHSKNTYILDDLKYSILKNYILEESTNYAEEVLNYDYTHYKFSQSWVSIKNQNQEHKAHSHTHSLISGVLFYEEFIPNTPSLFFNRMDMYTESVLAHKYKNMNGSNFLEMVFEVPYKKNLLVLFPSYLTHAVQVKKSNSPRKSLAFNVVPKDGFGREEFLNELKF